VIITTAEARLRVLAAYRRHRGRGISPAGAMHAVRDYYAVSIARAAAAGHQPPPDMVSCYTAAEGYYQSIPARSTYWLTGRKGTRTWRETELRARSARKRLRLCPD
jgi:hypothetical protein